MDNFEDVLNQHKEKARKVYAESGEGNLVNSAMREIESNCADYEYYFQMGQQSKQKRIDELQARVDAALFDMNQRKLELCESCDGYKDPVGVCQSEGLEMAINILKQALKGGEV
ncbi:hypothetical protein [uncultured Acinetobacter sp.]|uniref:hypothetical protein n=1 Tax=uncultured Acinetobacter sp. TaxID=165433 RepID=UPI00258B7028|nr:hypothetical protein [uncultured Acinetobacter sp.]